MIVAHLIRVGMGQRVLKVLLACAVFWMPAMGQVEIACAPTSVKLSRAGLDRRTAKVIQYVPCVVTNLGSMDVTVSEGEIQGWMIRQGIVALSSQVVREGSEEVKRRGAAKTVGRTLPFLATIATSLIAVEGVKIREDWIKAAFSFGSFVLPQIGEHVAARSPDVAIFDRLAIGASGIGLAAGQSQGVSMFAARAQDSIGNVSGVLRRAPPDPEIPTFSSFPAFSSWEGTTQDLWNDTVWDHGGQWGEL